MPAWIEWTAAFAITLGMYFVAYAAAVILSQIVDAWEDCRETLRKEQREMEEA